MGDEPNRPTMTDLPTKRVEALAEAIWTASRADEGTISATGAKIVAQTIAPLLADWRAEDEQQYRGHGQAAWTAGYHRGQQQITAAVEAVLDRYDGDPSVPVDDIRAALPGEVGGWAADRIRVEERERVARMLEWKAAQGKLRGGATAAAAFREAARITRQQEETRG